MRNKHQSDWRRLRYSWPPFQLWLWRTGLRGGKEDDSLVGVFNAVRRLCLPGHDADGAGDRKREG